MTVEIWSDIMCPFCYIGKRQFEAGLAQFEGKEEVAVIWRSFQLNPYLEAGKGAGVYEYLAAAKGISLDQSRQIHRQVAHMAAAAGLDYDFDKAIVANTYDAHRLIQLAKTQALGDAAEERLFRAYFTEGKNLGDRAVLQALGEEIGLEKSAVDEVLAGNAFAANVAAEIAEAEAIGVRGVPFFVFERKYAVSGAQAPEAFLDALKQTYNGQLAGNSCSTDGPCE